MKKLAIGILSLAMLACFAVAAVAQGPRGTSAITVGGKNVSVEYGRPSLSGRTTDELLGKLKAGGIWRLGSNTSTTFTTDVDLNFGGVTIPAGVYSIWMQRQEDNSWKLLFDKKHGQWGVPVPDMSEIFASAPLAANKGLEPAEMVTLTLRRKGHGGTLTIQWGTLVAVGSFTAAS